MAIDSIPLPPKFPERKPAAGSAAARHGMGRPYKGGKGKRFRIDPGMTPTERIAPMNHLSTPVFPTPQVLAPRAGPAPGGGEERDNPLISGT